MAAKFLFLVFAVFLLAQANATPREKREEPTTKGPLDTLRESFEGLLAKAQENFKPDELWNTFSTNMKELGEKIEANTKDIASAVQKKTAELMKDEKEAAPAA